MTLKEICDLKDQGYTLDEIERINKILESTGAEAPDEDSGPENDSFDDEPSGNEQPVDDDQPTLNDPNEPDYEKLYKDLVKKNQDDAAKKDRSKDEELQQASIQDAVAAYFKAKFT